MAVAIGIVRSNHSIAGNTAAGYASASVVPIVAADNNLSRHLLAASCGTYLLEPPAVLAALPSRVLHHSPTAAAVLTQQRHHFQCRRMEEEAVVEAGLIADQTPTEEVEAALNRQTLRHSYSVSSTNHHFLLLAPSRYPPDTISSRMMANETTMVFVPSRHLFGTPKA